MPSSRTYSCSSGGAACPELHGVHPRGKPRELGGDSKAMAKMKTKISILSLRLIAFLNMFSKILKGLDML